MSTLTPASTAEVLAALDQVRDPELDRSVVDLGFVSSVSLEGSRLRVALRLPTYWCAANFSFLMVQDAKRALSELPGVSEVEVELVEHFAAEQINVGVAQGHSFAESFPDEAEADLDQLRDRFARKGLAARLHRLCRRLLEAGMTQQQVATLCLGDLPPSDEAVDYLSRRAELGLPTEGDSPLLVDESGQPVEPERAEIYLVWVRAVSSSLEGNTAYCRGLLATRYGLPGEAGALAAPASEEVGP
jgi:metal-sulfur cluster biosynthetic enzyme